MMDVDDSVLCDRIRSHDPTGLDEFVHRDYGISRLFVLDLPRHRRSRVLHTAWTSVIDDIIAGKVDSRLRMHLLQRLLSQLGQELTESPPAGEVKTHSFLEEPDRWAGWWDQEPKTWPESGAIGSETVIAALHRLPARSREMLLLRDAAGLDAQSVQEITARRPDEQVALLDLARETFIDHLDAELGD